MQAGKLDLAERIGRRLVEDSGSFADGMEAGPGAPVPGDLVGLREHLAELRTRADGPGELRAARCSRPLPSASSAMTPSSPTG
jgi:hypothetical protein